MKAKDTILILFAICCLWQTNSNAQCDANSDFVQFSTTNWYDIDIPNDNRPDNAGQTFFATCSGPIRGVTLGTDNVSGGNIGGASMTAQLWRNPFSNGRVLMTSQTQDIPFSPTEGSNVDHYFPFTSLPQLVSGTEYAIVFVLNDTQYTVGVRVDVNNVYTNGNFIRDWATQGTGNWDLRIRVHYEDNVAPNANCRNITRALGANNTLNLNASAINNNSSDADSGIATYSLSKNTFDCNDVGYNSIRLIVTDQNGNSDVCESVVMITDGNDPVLTCPGDMTVTADPETGTAIVNYADVTYDDCTFEWVDGFDFIGTHDGRSYFVSHSPLVPSEAFANAELQGGHVTTVIDAEHNDWLRAAVDNQGLTNENILIGYNDVAQEDTFVWHNPNGGSTYENWATIEPNDAGAGEDYTIMNGGGRWNDVNNGTARKYILEKSEANIRQSSGLVSGSEFPVGTTINYFSATDAFGNTGNCFFIVEVLPPPTETTVELDNGKLIITDIESDSSDQITFSSDGTTLTISDLIVPSVSGGPTLLDPTTVTVPLASITNGIEFNSANGSNNGFNIITFANDLTLTGVNNGITLTGLKNYVQTGSINIEGDLTINGIGFDLTLGEITANNFTIDGVDRILDQEIALTISGVTQLQAGDGVNLLNGQGRHTFGGEVNLTSGELIFSATGNTTFGEINATDQGVGLPHTFTVAPTGDITFNGDVTILGSNANLFVCGLNSISQTGGSIETPFLVFRGNGNTTVTIDNNNNIQALGTSNPFDANAVDLASLSYTNTSNMFLEVIDVDEFTLTAPQFDIEPGFTNITKRGSGVSNFNADIDMNNGTGTVIINHNAGTINFNGDTNDFLSKLTYNGVAGTITNINSDLTTFPDVEADNHFTFGFLNVIGDVNIGNNQINILNEARFIGDGSPFAGDVMSPHILRGSGSILGGPVILENEFVLVPGEFNEGLTIVINDLQINGGVFAPLIIGETSHDRVDVNGTVTLTNATLFPSQGFSQLNQEVILINNDGNDAVVGVFDNLPEGSAITLDGGFTGIISYVGGDGNDVVLTIAETEVDLSGGTLTINDINGAVSDDAIVLSNDGTTLTISNLVAPVKIVGAVTSLSETSVSLPLASITNGFQFLSEDGVDSITIDDTLTLSGSDNFFIADNIDNYTQNAALTVGGSIWLSGNDTSNILFGEITASNLNLIQFNNVDDSEGRLNISGNVTMRTNGIVNIDNGSGNESNHFFGGVVDIEASMVSNFTTGSDLSIGIRTTATDGVHNIITSSGTITFSGISTTAGNSDINASATTSITQLADATITTDELIITATTTTNVALLSATNDINLLTTNSLIFGLSITDVDDLELGTITVDEFTITAPSINLTSNTTFTKIGSGVGSFVGNAFSNSGTGTISHSGGTIIFNGDTVLFGGITYNGLAGTTTKFTGGQTFIGNNFTFGTLLAEDRFVIESGLVTVLNETIVGNDVGPDNTKIFGGYGTFTGSPTTISTNGEILPFTFGSLTFENDLRIENGGKFNALLFGTELDDYARINVLGTVTLDNAELEAAFAILSSEVGPGFELVIIDNDDVDPIVGTFNGFPEGAMLEASVGGTIKTGTLSYTLGTGNDFGWKYDDVAPTAVCQDLTLNIGLGGITVTGDQLDGGATDNTEITEILIDGQPSLDFVYGDDGDHVVTVTFADTNGNTAECMATITINSNATLPILISEYKPVSGGSTQEIEIKGEPGESFAGTFVVIDGVSSRNIGLVKSADSFSGTFDANGLLTATIPDIQDPSHTTVLTTSFTGTVGVTDVDTDDDGTVDDMTSFGQILDAVGITNGAVCCPIDVIYGQEFGGIDLPYIGGQASAIFREASVGDFYQISIATGDIYDTTVTVVDASIFSTTPTAAGTFGSINPARSIAIQPRIFLQGAALNPIAGEEHLMRDDLRVAGLLPTMSPYGDASTGSDSFFDTGNDNTNIVDWVWVELRDATDNTIIVEGRSALLRRDGDIVSLNNNSALSFDVPPANYYVVIKHRNHLGIMSASAIALSSTTTTVDFTDGSVSAFGTNAQTTFGMPSGKVGMWTGNVNGDTIVQYSGTTPDTPDILSKVLNDPGNFLNFPTYAVSGYQNYDINMDGNTQYSGTTPDTPFILQNVLAHPGNFLNFSTYQITEQLPENQ